MVSAEDIKELRARTGAGIMECKKALVEAKGDLDKAVEIMRKSGQAKADKKSSRITAEGIVVIEAKTNLATIVEINCETDFVARDQNFIQFANLVVKTALDYPTSDVAKLLEQKPKGQSSTLEQIRHELVAKLGENIQVRRLICLQSSDQVGQYLHGSRIGVLVQLQGGDANLAKDIAMHIAASKPVVINPDDVDQELLNKERDIYMTQAVATGKPKDIIERMVNERLKKFKSENALTGQPFVKEPKKTVGQLLTEHKAQVKQFVRYEVGEGIEKKQGNFAEEVKAQMTSH